MCLNPLYLCEGCTGLGDTSQGLGRRVCKYVRVIACLLRRSWLTYRQSTRCRLTFGLWKSVFWMLNAADPEREQVHRLIQEHPTWLRGSTPVFHFISHGTATPPTIRAPHLVPNSTQSLSRKHVSCIRFIHIKSIIHACSLGCFLLAKVLICALNSWSAIIASTSRNNSV